MSQLPPEAVAYQQAHLAQDHHKDLGAFFTVCIALSAICFLTRIWSRRLTDYGMGVDDYCFLVGSAIAIGSFCVLDIYAFRAGLGMHWIALTPSQMALFPKLNYAYDILNVVCYPIIKISILLFYLRIFPQHRFKQCVWAAIAFVVLYCTAITLSGIFPCWPIQAFWDATVTPQWCLDTTKWSYSQAALNVFTDLVILALPIPVIAHLHVSTSRRVAIMMLFLAGGLTFVISIVRIYWYTQFDATDASYSFIDDGYGTASEVTLAMICACAPTWRPLSLRARRASVDLYTRLHSSSELIRKLSRKSGPSDDRATSSKEMYSGSAPE